VTLGAALDSYTLDSYTLDSYTLDSYTLDSYGSPCSSTRATFPVYRCSSWTSRSPSGSNR
jgi:hypothetical protein